MRAETLEYVSHLVDHTLLVLLIHTCPTRHPNDTDETAREEEKDEEQTGNVSDDRIPMEIEEVLHELFSPNVCSYFLQTDAEQCITREMPIKDCNNPYLLTQSQAETNQLERIQRSTPKVVLDDLHMYSQSLDYSLHEAQARVEQALRNTPQTLKNRAEEITPHIAPDDARYVPRNAPRISPEREHESRWAEIERLRLSDNVNLRMAELRKHSKAIYGCVNRLKITQAKSQL